MRRSVFRWEASFRLCRRWLTIQRFLALIRPTPADQITQVNRNQIQVKSVEGILWDQFEMSSRFTTAGIHHDLVAGAEGGQEISNPIRYSYTINKINTVPDTTPAEPE